MSDSATSPANDGLVDFVSLPDTSDSSWQGDSDDNATVATEISAKHLRVDTSRDGTRIPAFPLGGFKSAVFHDFKVYNETPDEDIKKLASSQTSPFTLFSFNDLQLRVEGQTHLIGDDRVSARFLHKKILPGSEDDRLIYPEQSQAATVTIAGVDYAMVVLQEILRGEHRELAEALGVVCPSFNARLKWWTFDVVALSAKGFFYKGHLIIIHAELVAPSRPWKNLPV
ncbi:hypothetical protein P7C70_g3364, partial [Phenoliferia sp. Uapishka_3]